MAKKEVAFVDMLRDTERFKKLKDRWVKDTLLNIDWGPSSDKTMDWEAAKNYAAGFGGRLPNRVELITLIDDTKYQPAINTEFFKDTKTDDWYWTETSCAGVPDGAWVVGFDDGYVYGSRKSSNSYVRPVRSSE